MPEMASRIDPGAGRPTRIGGLGAQFPGTPEAGPGVIESGFLSPFSKATFQRSLSLGSWQETRVGCPPRQTRVPSAPASQNQACCKELSEHQAGARGLGRAHSLPPGRPPSEQGLEGLHALCMPSTTSPFGTHEQERECG